MIHYRGWPTKTTIWVEPIDPINQRGFWSFYITWYELHPTWGSWSLGSWVRLALYNHSLPTSVCPFNIYINRIKYISIWTPFTSRYCVSISFYLSVNCCSCSCMTYLSLLIFSFFYSMTVTNSLEIMDLSSSERNFILETLASVMNRVSLVSSRTLTY